MSMSKLLSPLVFALMGVVCSSAMASVVTFEEKTAFSCVYGTQSSGGLNFSYPGGAACYYSPSARADFPSMPSSTVMGFGYSDITISKTDGGVFTLNSVDLGFGPWDHGVSDITRVTGYLQGGGTISKELTVGLAFKTFQLEWSNLDRVVFSKLVNTGQYLAFDNIRFNESQVPEPTTVTLFGIAAAGLALGRRRRKQG